MKVCRYRPNRTKKRQFHTCDAARIAKAASLRDGRDHVIGSVGFKLGYVLLYDGSSLTEGELQRRITTILQGAEFVNEVLSQIPAGTFFKLFVRLATKFAVQFAKVAAPILLLVLKPFRIVPLDACD